MPLERRRHAYSRSSGAPRSPEAGFPGVPGRIKHQVQILANGRERHDTAGFASRPERVYYPAGSDLHDVCTTGALRKYSDHLLRIDGHIARQGHRLAQRFEIGQQGEVDRELDGIAAAKRAEIVDALTEIVQDRFCPVEIRFGTTSKAHKVAAACHRRCTGYR